MNCAVRPFLSLYALNKTSEIEDGLSAVLGFDFKINEKKGNGIDKEKLSLSVGQVFNNDRYNDMPSKSSLDQKMSDVVGKIDYNFSKIGNLSYKFLLDNKGLISGVQFTITRAECPWNAAHLVSNFANKTGCNPYLYVKSTEASPAERFNDEISNTLRFGDICLAAIGNNVNVIIDTFDDADRGYFTRTGLVDRRFNPRLASNICLLYTSPSPRD